MRVTFDTEVLKNKIIKIGKAIIKDPNKELKQSIIKVQTTVDNLETEIKNKTRSTETPITINKKVIVKEERYNYWSASETKLVLAQIAIYKDLKSKKLAAEIHTKGLLPNRTKKAINTKVGNERYRLAKEKISKSNTRKSTLIR